MTKKKKKIIFRTRFVFLTALTVVLTIISLGYIQLEGRHYEAVFELDGPVKPGDVQVDVLPEGIAKPEEVRIEENRVFVDMEAMENGETTLKLRMDGEEASMDLRVRSNVVGRPDGTFNGSRSVLICLIILMSSVSIVFTWTYFEMNRDARYSYRMISLGGVDLFCLFQTGVLAVTLAAGEASSVRAVFFNLGTMSRSFVIYTAPLILCLSLALILSNVVLMKKESYSLKNMLGILFGLVWGIAVFIVTYLSTVAFRDPFQQQTKMVLVTILYTCICFAECLFLSTCLSAWLAAIHEPRMDKDFLVILGASIRRDGTPTPLLRGRVDRAIEFEKKQYNRTGNHAFFVPSGGKGGNEVCSEASSMAGYLESRGIPRERILLEDRSRNTFENMKFSRELIESRQKNARSAFSTTSYHVFRSYIYASRNAFRAEGMGSSTRWYFFPNAFLREFVSLLRTEWLSVLVVMLDIALAFAVMGTMYQL